MISGCGDKGKACPKGEVQAAEEVEVTSSKLAEIDHFKNVIGV